MKLPVDELYGPVLAGEGAQIGQRTMFVRIGACDGVDGKGNLCVWCDSLHAADSKNKSLWTFMNEQDILSGLTSLAPWCKVVTLSGGNPCLYDLSLLVAELHAADYTICIETQATKCPEWLWRCEYVTASPKPPSAGYALDRALFTWFSTEIHQSNDVKSPPNTTLKIVVDPDNEEDKAFATDMVHEWSDVYDNTYLSCLTNASDSRDDLLDRFGRLAEWVMHEPDHRFDIGCLPQLHVATFGHGRGL